MMLATAADAISYRDLGLSPIALDLGWFQLRWYSLAYLAGIILGWWYLLKLIDQPRAPMARRHADDMVFFATLGVIIGGRLGYVLFYKPMDYFADPVAILRLWDGGMSFHGGVIGVSLGILWMARQHKLDWLRIHDYVACCVPFGLFFGRLANFVNSELWGGVTDVPWAVRFCEAFDRSGACQIVGSARHPSQLYEAALEGILLFAVLGWMFWKTRARYQPGKLVGAFLLVYGLSRFLVEFIREPDTHLVEFSRNYWLHMGQWLSLPMILGGLYLIVTAKRREGRVSAVPAEDKLADEPA
ncbi:prolipoprotein diacylglyceryl transferase [Sphingosinicella sp.]|uniref:prolipoprotein diacylglyceryl transferase n=1 Tax=Sphingosinicella sp. TaxID=1917971 RepID=UPI004037A6A9